MAISNNYVPLKELGNGSTVEFSDTWQILSASYIRVFLEDVTTGVQTPVDAGGAGDEYVLTSFDSGGFIVTFNTAPTSANYVVITRDVAEDQTSPYSTSKGFQGLTLENSLDKLTAIDQDQSNDIGRSLKFQLGSTATGSLPDPVDDLFLGWDGAAGAVKNSVKTITEVEDAVDAVEALSAGSGVKVSSNDTTVGFLNGKLVAGTGISFVENNDGANETLTFNLGTVANADLADMVQATIKGRAAAAGTGVPVDLTATEVRTLADVYSTGEADAAIGAAVGLVLISTATASASTTVDFTSGIDGTYDEYERHISDLVPATDTTSLYLRTSTDGGSTFDAGASDYTYVASGVRAGGVLDTETATATFINLGVSETTLDNGGVGVSHYVVTISSPANAATYGNIHFKGWGQNTSLNAFVSHGAGSRAAAADVDAIRFLMSSGNITSGKFKLYGVRKS